MSDFENVRIPGPVPHRMPPLTAVGHLIVDEQVALNGPIMRQSYVAMQFGPNGTPMYCEPDEARFLAESLERMADSVDEERNDDG